MRADFRVEEVLERATREFGPLAPGVRQHLSSHAVASIPPSPGNHKMFTRTGRGRLRLFQRGDATHSERHGKIMPREEEIPLRYRPLLRWYLSEYDQQDCSPEKAETANDFLAFIGIIPAYDLRMMEEAIERECERIEPGTHEEIA